MFCFGDRLEEEGLPVPRSWAVLKPKASIPTGGIQLVFAADTPRWSSGSNGAAAPGAAPVAMEVRGIYAL